MKRTALLLGALMLGGLLAAPPAAAAPAVKVVVAKVKASSANRSGACPTTVGFSATVSARGKGTVRYRWVRGDGSKGAIRSFAVSGARKFTVRDRQTFETSARGWQAVEILGVRGLSRKAYFRVRCAGPVRVYDVDHLLPADSTEQLVAAAHVDVTPPAYNGTCPATVRFTGTVQVSRVPARVAYRWVDSAQGEGPVEYLDFPAGGPRLKQVSLPLSVGGAARGWKAIHVAQGYDSGRAAYQVTCTGTPPRPGPNPSPSHSPSPSSSPTPSQSPSPGPTRPTPSPSQTDPSAPKPVVAIPYLSPGDYEGSCTAPVVYDAWGTIGLPPGPATTVTYWWILDGSPWKKQQIDIPAGAGPRSQYVLGTFPLNDQQSGTHTLGLMAEGGPSEPVERTFVLKCLTEPHDVTVSIDRISHNVTYPDPTCDEPPRIGLGVTLTLDRAGEVKYRWTVAGRTYVYENALRAGTTSISGGAHSTTASGTVRFEVLNHNMPVKEISYTVSCPPKKS
ncbi:hypothetical protein ACFXJ8_39450 [Nonomuraea sp. NPDC059194]|uniref:hypothetical protein n=1 Tax=Nonomuraea sp. NPDC059194 TaxID=3346764 RepID=UPI003685718B